MKLSRDYLLGLGSGLVLSALITTFLVYSGGLMGANHAAGTAPSAVPATSGKSNATNQSDQVKPVSNGATGNTAGDATTGPTASGSTPSQPSASDVGGQAPPAGSGSGHGQAQSVQVFVIPNGVTAERIADLLIAQGLLTDRQGFLDLVKQQGAASRFRAGTYQLLPGLTKEDLLQRLLG